MSDKRKRAARAIMAETGWNYTRALREADRRHAEAKDKPEEVADVWPGGGDGGTGNAQQE